MLTSLQLIPLVLSIVLGFLLNKIAKEEITQYKNKIKITKIILIGLIPIIIFYDNLNLIPIILFTGVLVFLTKSKNKSLEKIKKIPNHFLIYPLLGITSVFLSIPSTSQILLSILIIFLMIESSLQYSTIITTVHAALVIILFIIPIFILMILTNFPLIETFIKANFDILTGITTPILFSKIWARSSAW